MLHDAVRPKARILTAAAALPVLLAACEGEEERAAQAPPPIVVRQVAPPAQPAALDPAAVAQGRALYAEHCAACHGPDLEGAENWRQTNADGTLPPPPHDASGHTWHHSDGLLFAYVKFGGAEAMARMGMADFNSGMPGYDGVLTDAEIRAVLDFIKSTWPRKIREAQAQMTAAEAGANPFADALSDK